MASTIVEYLGPAPANEHCAQVGTEGFTKQNHFEIRLYRDQIIREHGEPPKGIGFSIDYSDHNFGRYAELVLVQTDTESMDESDYQLAYEYIEKAVGVIDWDAHSNKELRDNGYDYNSQCQSP